jgi:hypothetical protein
MTRPLALLLVLSLALLVPTAHAAPNTIEVTTCGQLIPKRTLGYLTADLDCTGFAGAPQDVPAYNAGARHLEEEVAADLRDLSPGQPRRVSATPGSGASPVREGSVRGLQRRHRR